MRLSILLTKASSLSMANGAKNPLKSEGLASSRQPNFCSTALFAKFKSTPSIRVRPNNSFKLMPLRGSA